MNIFISSITSDIAEYICQQFLNKGNRIICTYRKQPDNALRDKILKYGGVLLPCEFSKEEDVDRLIIDLRKLDLKWDVFVSAVGVMTPIDRFENIDIDRWEENIYINSISQIRLLRGMLSQRNNNASVYFMTSKGVNDPFPQHSAYCISKILLVKMCELLDNEFDDCKFIAFNPGFINTKIINQEGTSFKKHDGSLKLSLQKVWEFIEWSISKEKSVVSGRNFFVKYDEWEDDAFADKLYNEKNMYKLRRCGDTWFLKGGRYESKGC